MSLTPLDPRSTRGKLVVAAVCGLVLIPAVLAQQQRMMVFEADDGSAPQVLQYTGPSFGGLRTPDFIRRDLPVFHDKLELNDVQQLIVTTLLETYLDAFKVLVEESTPKMSLPGMNGMMMGHGMDMAEHDHEHGGHGGDFDMILDDAMGEVGGAVHDMDIEMTGDGSGGTAVAIAIRTGDGGETMDMAEDMEGQDVTVWAGTVSDPETGEEMPDSGVAVMMAMPEGVEIPEEVRQQLEQAVQRLTEQLESRLADLQAEGLTREEALEEMAPQPMSPDEHEALMDQMRQAVDDFVKAKAALKESFLTEVRGQLTAEQFGNWPTFERTLTRVKTLPKGRLDGERTDLLVVLDSIEVDGKPAEGFDVALQEYEVELDRALVQRNDYLDEAQKKLDESMQAGDFKDAVTVAERAARLRVAVRDVNQRYTESIAGKLPAGSAEDFRTSALKRSFPRVYRTTYAQKSFRKARALEGLDADILESIDTIETAYLAELGPVNDRIRETILREEPKESVRMLERVQEMMDGGGGAMMIHDVDDPIRTAMKKRKDLDERYIKQLHAVLSPEQVATLPPLPSQARREPLIFQRSTSSD